MSNEMNDKTNKTNKTIVGACPLDCPDACSWIVRLENGVPVKLSGNPNHPFTGKNLCVKVNPYLAYTAHPDRLLYPMRRIGAKGAGQFERISWQQALEDSASRLTSIIDKYGGEAIWPFAGSGTLGYIQGIGGAGKRLFHALGASVHDANICAAAAYPGLQYTSGRGSSMDPIDTRRAGVVLIWGANTLSTNQHLWPFILEAKRGGAKIIVVDPVTTRTAKRADLHLSIRPGTDGALALGLMTHFVDTAKVDPRVYKAIGWEAFRDEVLAEWSVARAATECDIEPKKITELAELMAGSGPVALRLGMGMQRHAHGGQAARLISCLPLFTGDYHRLGGGLCYSTHPHYALNTDKLNRPELCPKASPPARTLSMTRLGQGLLDLDDPPVKALFITAANPVSSNPDQNRVRQGLARPDLFCVVVDNFQTDTADYADILLPSTMQTEHLDIHDSVTHLFLNFNNAVCAPPGECLTHTEIFRRLAIAMGQTNPLLAATDLELIGDALDTDDPAIANIHIDQLQATGFARLGVPEPFLPFAEHFNTPSGRFEFASIAAEAAGHGLLPNYRAPREATCPVISSDGIESLALIAAANHFQLNSMFANSSTKTGAPIIGLHPHDASQRGLVAGEFVRVHNDRGEFKASLAVTENTRPGVATMTKGHWPKLVGGSTVNATTLEADADMGRGAIFHDNQVFVERVPEGLEVQPLPPEATNR